MEYVLKTCTFKTLWLLWVSIVPRELSLQKILLLLTMIENKTSWNPLVNKTWQHIILTFCWRTSCYSTVVIRVFDLKISTNYVQNIKMSAFCPHSFAQTKTKGTELPDTFSPGKEQAQFFVSMRSLGIYMLHRDWTERKRPLTHCRPRLSTRSRASPWSLPLNSLSRYMTSMTMSPNLPGLSTLPVYLKCQTSVSEWKLLFLPLLLFEVHLLSCWNTAPGCDIPVTAVFLRSKMAQCYWFLEGFFLLHLTSLWSMYYYGVWHLNKWARLSLHFVLFCCWLGFKSI